MPGKVTSATPPPREIVNSETCRTPLAAGDPAGDMSVSRGAGMMLPDDRASGRWNGHPQLHLFAQMVRSANVIFVFS